MKRTLYILSCILISFTLILGGCSSKASEPESLYEQTVEDLTDPDLMGRLTGTAGNLAAQQIIETQFKETGLSPLTPDGYLQEYSQLMYHPDRSGMTLEVKGKDGTSTSFVYGQDFLEQRSRTSFKTDSELVIGTVNRDIHNRVVMLEQTDVLAGALEQQPAAILIESELFMKRLPNLSASVPVIQISPKTAEWLQQHEKEIASVVISMNPEGEEITAANVVGYIPGSQSLDHRHAIVVSAHFDHVGWSGSGDARTIYRGSVDNASGVSAILQLAALLSSEKAVKLQSDIIFAAFNGEESELQGSEAFVKNISEAYSHVYNINLDCIGIKDGGKMLLVGKDASPLKAVLSSYLSDHGIENTINGSYGDSDHSSFLEAGFDAVTLAQEQLGAIHTANDVPDRLDYTLLDQYVIGLSAFIQEQGDAESIIHGVPSQLSTEIVEATPEQIAAQKKLLDEAQTEINQLHLGEYKLIGNEQASLLAEGQSEEFTEKSVAEKSVGGLQLPDAIGDFNFAAARINVSLPENTIKETTELELNALYRADITMNEVRSLSVIYKKESNEGISVSINKAPIEFEGSNFTITTETLDDEMYKIIDTGTNIMILTEVTVNKSKYYLQIYGGKDSQLNGETNFILNWASKDKSQAIKWVHDMPWSEIIEKMGFTSL